MHSKQGYLCNGSNRVTQGVFLHYLAYITIHLQCARQRTAPRGVLRCVAAPDRCERDSRLLLANLTA